jgi:SAM-dependent methyltransferase
VTYVDDSVAELWDDVIVEWRARGADGSWRMASDLTNGGLIERWLPPDPAGSVLKTDLFDELVGAGLVPDLFGRYAAVTAVDVSAEAVKSAGLRYPGLEAEFADIRDLPFDGGAFDAIVSNSTLDHLPTMADISDGLAELMRVLRPGGRLLVTVDNRTNPLVALRNSLPAGVRARTPLFPYPVGATCGARRLRRLLEETGFEVAELTTIVHCPRVLAVAGGQLVDRRCHDGGKRRYARWLVRFEALEALPTRWVTGHFAAALALKPQN